MSESAMSIKRRKWIQRFDFLIRDVLKKNFATNKTIEVKNAREVKIESIEIGTSPPKSFYLALPQPGPLPSFFAFSLPKAGSVLLNNILADVCAEWGMPAVSIHEEAFKRGISPLHLGAAGLRECLFENGYAYLGFRSFLPRGLEVDLNQTKKILLVRDPRDMLVSLYFSIKISHDIPNAKTDFTDQMRKRREDARNQDIETFVKLNSEKVLVRYKEYMDFLLPLKNVRVFRYEDVIFEKYRWLEEMIDFLGGSLKKEVVKEIAQRHDIFPSSENPQQHIRQVSPGNFNKHLSKNTISYLNAKLEPVLSVFQYL
jgi:hypothetical protein